MKQYKFYFIFYGCLVLFFLATLKFAPTFNAFSFFIVLLCFPTQITWNQKIRKELDYMWQLADELHLSTSDISQISGIGTLDLKASKEKNSAVFIPRRKAVLSTIKEFEAKKELRDKN